MCGLFNSIYQKKCTRMLRNPSHPQIIIKIMQQYQLEDMMYKYEVFVSSSTPQENT
eukprot:c17832_g1_i1 orf=267-434(-)